jgi:Holliday junction resolvase RusA-like endonuclease
MVAGMAVGESAGAGSRRTLLAAVPLPLPPSINSYWSERIVWSPEKKRHFPIRYVTHEGKAYQQYIRELMLERRAWFRSPHPLALSILCCFADEKGHDLDNRVKVLQDALKNGFVLVDDKQVKRLEVREGPRMKPATVFVRLEEILPDRNANLTWIRQGP